MSDPLPPAPIHVLEPRLLSESQQDALAAMMQAAGQVGEKDIATFFATKGEHDAGCPVLAVRENRRSCECAAGLNRRQQADALICSHLRRQGSFFESTAGGPALFGTLHRELDVEGRSRFIQAYKRVVQEIIGGVFYSNAKLDRRRPRRRRQPESGRLNTTGCNK